MNTERRKEVAVKLLGYIIKEGGLIKFEESFGRANLPKVAEATGLTTDEITEFINAEKQERLNERVSSGNVNEQSFFRAWQSQEKMISDAISAQGAVIRIYLDANKTKFKVAEVQKEDHPHGQLTPMLQFPPTYNTYYYCDGNFYRAVGWQSWGQRQRAVYSVVSMIVGEELQALWKNTAFVKTIFGFDAVGGSLPIGAML